MALHVFTEWLPEISVVLIDHQARVHDGKKIVFRQRKTITNFSLDCGKTECMCHSTSSQLKNATNMIMGLTQGLRKVPSGHPGQVGFLSRQVSFNFSHALGKSSAK